ncbi:Aminotransferase-like [Macleaya cordata]|uniref:Aminotransferase-like n=1 Tax=Macleaya cordata TaxID=56857 RepID=A0A200PPQ9_MACCD|nr:Aminotransferase-like [Macleaya cordata]
MAGEYPGMHNKLDRTCAYRLIEETLGLPKSEVGDNLDSHRNLHLDWLRKKFKGCKKREKLDTTKHKARTYLLYMIGCVMCPDKTCNRVGVHHLHLLRDVENLPSICWRNGVLAHLFKELTPATRCGTKSFIGCSTLLHAWIFMHFPGLGRFGYQESFREPMPMICKYTSTALERGQREALVVLRERIDDLPLSDVA